MTGSCLLRQPTLTTRNGSAVEKEISRADALASSSRARRRRTVARRPRARASRRVKTYVAGPERDGRSTALTVKSACVSTRAAPPPTPGRGRRSIVVMRASAAASSASGKTRVISLTCGNPSEPSAGVEELGVDMSVESVNVLASTFQVKRARAGHGSAGLNWRVWPSSQVNAPGWAGENVTKRCGLSSAPPCCGPISRLKKIVTGSQRLRK